MIKFTRDDIIKYNREVLPSVKDIEPIYSIVTRARRQRIKGGEDIQLDIYLSGLGIPDANKCFLSWSSPDIVDTSSVGRCTHCTKLVTQKKNGKELLFPIASKDNVEHGELDPNGLWVSFTKAHFLPRPTLPIGEKGETELPMIMAELTTTDVGPALSISLKTLRKAKSGDYAIDAIFTYKFRNILRQASDRVTFHVTSWWDRNEALILTVGSVAAFILLVVTVTLTLTLISLLNP